MDKKVLTKQNVIKHAIEFLEKFKDTNPEDIDYLVVEVLINKGELVKVNLISVN